MPRTNRGYKRGEPHRDATLFVIACEGAVREKEYFEHLGYESSRIRIKVLKQGDQHKSAPKWVLDCAAKYQSDIGLSNDDQLWLVMDVDHWQEDHLRDINQACIDNAYWNLALSNPCFEVWLYLHIDDITRSSSTTCQALKTELSQKVKGGYNCKLFIKKIREAHERALELDPNPSKHFLPEPMRTKMHLLTADVLKIIGINFVK